MYNLPRRHEGHGVKKPLYLHKEQKSEGAVEAKAALPLQGGNDYYPLTVTLLGLLDLSFHLFYSL